MIYNLAIDAGALLGVANVLLMRGMIYNLATETGVLLLERECSLTRTCSLTKTVLILCVLLLILA